MGGSEYADYAAAAEDGMSVAHAAARTPERVAVYAETGNRTFAELNANANRLVRVLRDNGVGYGDRIALLCRNRAEFVDVVAAAFRGGFWLTTINWHLTADEVEYVAEDCGAKALFVDATVPCAEAVADIATAPLIVSIAGKLPRATPYDDFIAGVDGSDIEDPQRGSTMLYTSGTTGRPKGVFRAHPGAVGPNTSLYDEDCVHLCTGPLYHAAPLGVSLTTPLTWGASVVLMDGWSPDDTLRLIAQHRVTHTHMVPTMFNRLLNLPDAVRARADTSSLRIVVHGAAPCPVVVKQRMIEWWGPILWEYYAATEGGATLVDSHTWLEHPGTVGRHLREDGIVIRDDDGNECPPGVPGTVWIRTARGAEFEYFGDEAKTAKTVVGRYFSLGDVGYLDEDRWLFLTDRSANLIISGGVNIYPAEVDAVVLAHPAVGDVAVIGVPNDDMGEEVKAVVELRDGYAPSPELAADIIAFARERIAHFKCPRTLDFVDRLPREDNGKIYKRRLREEYRSAIADR
ncbi:MAG TPA: AMP-binding protein [Acidimicrobiales bacterium]|nr:AMP-binding protein [Acidimicrobiales bacterium]